MIKLLVASKTAPPIGVPIRHANPSNNPSNPKDEVNFSNPGSEDMIIFTCTYSRFTKLISSYLQKERIKS